MQRNDKRNEKSKPLSKKLVSDMAELHIRRCNDVINGIVAFYDTNNDNRIYTPLKGKLPPKKYSCHPKDEKKRNYHFILSAHNLDSPSSTEKLAMAHANTWNKIQPVLRLLSKYAKNPNTKHNVLATIFSSNDDAFLSSLNDLGNEHQISGELLLIAAQRLKHISKHTKITNERSKANNLLTKIFTKSPECVLYFNEQQMQHELTNLIRNYYTNPNRKKIIWLGSQRMVNAKIKAETEKDKSEITTAFLLCDDNKWSWMLNRLWLQACAEIGYEILLIEQQFPNMIDAMLSGDIVQYIVELMKEIRPDDCTQTSQYSSQFEPTATCLEVLALMEMGCVAKKHPNGSIVFHKSKTMEAPEYLKGKHQDEDHRYMKLMRKHSCPNFFGMPPLPKLEKPSDHFKLPTKSPELRAKSIKK